MKSFILDPSLEILLPAFVADGLLLILPDLQASDWDTHLLCVGSAGQAGLGSDCPDADSLSVFDKLGKFIYEIHRWDAVELCKPVPHFFWDLPGNTFLDVHICMSAHTDLLRHLRLDQAPAVSEPAEPVRHILDILVSTVPLIELGRL